MSSIVFAQIFSLLALSSGAPPDLVTDLERVEVIAGAKDLLLPCRWRNKTFVEYFHEVYEFAIWRREKGESVSEVEDSDNCCLIDVVQLSPSQNF